MTGWEWLAALLGIAYLLLAMRQNIWCWVAGFSGNAIYLVVFFDAHLYMDSALQLFYMGVACYGWWHWHHGSAAGGALPVTRWRYPIHCYAVAAVLGLSLVSGYLLARYTDAALPYFDSFTTWGALLTSWMVARKLLENWLYWIVIDSLSVWLYLQRDLQITALLFFAYTVLAILGYVQWLSAYRRQST